MTAPRRVEAFRPRKQPSQERSRDTVRVILTAAARVFSARGYTETTTNDIAERAGVSVGSLYEYFPNKEAILVALLEEHLSEGEAILTKVWQQIDTCGDLYEVVRLFARAMFDLHRGSRGLHRVLVEAAPLPRRVRQRILDMDRGTIAHVEAYLRARPGLTRRDPAVAAAVMVQCIESLSHKVIVHDDDDATTEPYVQEMMTLVTAYLGTPDSPDKRGT